MRGAIPSLTTALTSKPLVPKSPSNDWTAPTTKMYAAVRTTGWRLSKWRNSRCRIKLKLKQERNAVLYLLGEWGRLVLSQLSALSQLLGEESKLKLVFVLAYVKLLPTVHKKEHWWSHKESVEGCKAELNRAYCSLEVTVLGRSRSAYFSKPVKWSRIYCFLQCSMNTLWREENCIITAEGEKGKRIFKGAKRAVFKPPPPEGAQTQQAKPLPSKSRRPMQSYVIRVRFLLMFSTLLPGFLNPCLISDFLISDLPPQI